MADEDDPFAGLDDALASETDHTEAADTTPDADPSAVTEQSPASVAEDEATSTQMATPDLDQPAFPFDDTTQRAFYARPETWEAFEDALDFEVRRALRDRGFRDVPKRELHDAVLQVITDHPDAVADNVEQMRRER